MNSLLDRRRLLAFSQLRRQRGEQALLRVQRQLQPLLQEQSGFEEQEAALQRLLSSHRANDCVLDHGQLLALLRTQAVIRRRIDLLRVERDRVDQQRRQVEQQLQVQREQLRGLQRKHDNYERAVQQLLRGQRLEAVRREERELEELIGVRR
ncbi:type III secretion protein [Pseudomonas sp. A25(2017)]|uniref:Surface presentation of antigen gene type M protein n=1 Tax=Pseudomonas kilonensis TaxID=132476 RepID=A0ABY0Z8P5_9PSED|nr:MULTISPECIES: type III secretion protein [Pseudomonas]OOG85024.1 type III secretion protein [Pseudomonas sp. A25(2017)]SEE43707.1 surface presentation of antigen gene type M protein [Pseudomonas kilonensis]